MGHTWDSKREKVSRFPRDWSDQKIANAIRDTLESPSYFSRGRVRRTVWKEIDGVLVEAGYNRIPDGNVVFTTAYPVMELPKGAKRVEG